MLDDVGVDVTYRDTLGDDAFISAGYHGHLEVIQYLAQRYPDKIQPKTNVNNTGYCAMIKASVNGHLKTVKYLVEEIGLDVSRKTKEKFSALILAAANGHPALVDYLLSHHRDKFNIDDVDETGDTALLSASEFGVFQACKSLIDAGADPNIERETGIYSLERAVVTLTRADVVALLLFRAHCRYDIAQEMGVFPIHHALDANPLIMQCLLMVGAYRDDIFERAEDWPIQNQSNLKNNKIMVNKWKEKTHNDRLCPLKLMILRKLRDNRKQFNVPKHFPHLLLCYEGIQMIDADIVEMIDDNE